MGPIRSKSMEPEMRNMSASTRSSHTLKKLHCQLPIVKGKTTRRW